jgi:hypothetical protein
MNTHENIGAALANALPHLLDHQQSFLFWGCGLVLTGRLLRTGWYRPNNRISHIAVDFKVGWLDAPRLHEPVWLPGFIFQHIGPYLFGFAGGGEGATTGLAGLDATETMTGEAL